MKRSDIKRRPLADTVIATLEPEMKEYREHDGNSLYLRVRSDGNKSWQFRYKKPDGKWSWLGLGSYPEVSGSLARQKAAELRADAANGSNPMATKRARKAAELEATNSTFERLAREWYASKRKNWTDGTAVRTIGALELHVFPIFGKRIYQEILPMEWMEFLRSMERKGIIEQTSRVRGMCREIYDLARVTGRATHNPLEGLHKFLQTKPVENYAHVSLEELPPLLRAIRSYPSAPDIRIGLHLLSMLACRPSELREARWTEFDLGKALWTIPSERMKRRREHLVPLPHQAIEQLLLLQNLTGHYQLLFPGRSDSTKPRSNTVFLMALRRLGYEGRQTGHGFRHIASTILNEHGFEENHIEAQLSHVKEGVAGVYNKAIYLKSRTAMMQWYADFLDSLEKGNVVHGQFAKAPQLRAP
ncbi:integrase arm-type DNA-binding domain-containing protein [Pseudomonas koreensis]|uniref:tyrosine-type recombinase/integrase n=1 Tax=Pseudomonas koreensis TaxID=198620 RepID=UPI0021C5EA34|nr:integrase arm-type DNA-binding domain-containing protein [Pseudomonas koreensis]MCU0072953.1 integrase arm-type DNA-binding domain-containing protein [Pseudomonas koreensis]